MTNSTIPPVAIASSFVRAPSSGRALGEVQLRKLRGLINQLGLSAAAKKLGLPRSSTANAGAGAGMREGTRLLFVDRLGRVECRW